MFTGLVQTLGKVQKLAADRLAIQCDWPDGSGLVASLALGDSVAVDGVCLTVASLRDRGFVATVSPETLDKTTLSLAVRGDRQVNLEGSLRLGSKIGGHFVTGHVDGVGEFLGATITGQAWEMRFRANPAIGQQIVSKGSIAINGISLTIATCSADGTWFQVAVIPHTYDHTNLHQLQPGDRVNLEADILGKYASRSSRHPLNPQAGQSAQALGLANDDHGPAIAPSPESGITIDFLTEHGYV